jgi:hypothetical protein
LLIAKNTGETVKAIESLSEGIKELRQVIGHCSSGPSDL